MIETEIRSSLQISLWKASCNTIWSDEKIAAFKAYQTKLFTGQVVNKSEQQAAWHTAYRAKNRIEEVQSTFAQMKKISEDIRQSAFTDIVHIGIGGSDLGPQLICDAFSDQIDGPNVHFISNIDTVPFKKLFAQLNPQRTLFVIVSKSFKTLETLENMKLALDWLHNHHCSPSQQVYAITHHKSRAMQHGISESHILFLPQWLGGRFSLWGGVGLTCAIAFGFEHFYQLHQGAQEVDDDFQECDIFVNQVVRYATQLYELLIVKKISTLIILPYCERLKLLLNYLQQLWMESLGKQVNTQGNPIEHPTGPLVFGGVGTSTQHSLQQWMMQGTHPFACDFILPLQQDNADSLSQQLLRANCMMQYHTLLKGAPNPDVRKQITPTEFVNLFIIEKLNFKSLGALLAFYEHVVVTLGFLLNVNPFDQFGVEHAKNT